MAAPAKLDGTWPRNSARRLHFPQIVDVAAAGGPLTSGTLTFQAYDEAGNTHGSPAAGSHLGSGEWEILVPPLNLTEDAKYRLTVTIDGPGAADVLKELWVRAVRDPLFP